MKPTNPYPIKAGWLVAAAVMLNVAAWAANIEYPGYVKVENFDNIAGDPVGNMLADPKYTNNQPDSVTFLTSLFWSRNPAADNYGSRITCFLTPPETADYVFFIASDNDSWLYLSTDSSPANLKFIAADQGWQNARTWTGGGGMDAGQTPPWRRGNRLTGEGPYENRSDTFLTSPLSNVVTTAGAQSWPNKDANGNAVIHLVAGQKYFLQYLFKEGGGGDNAGVAWKKATDPDPAIGDPEIMGTDGSTYTNLSIIFPDTMTFQSQPASRTVQAGQTVNFTVVPLGVPGDSDTTLFTYKWFTNDVEVTDGTGNAATYTILVAATSDSGRKFKCEVTSAGTSPAGTLVATTTNATLTVINDTVPPTISTIRSSDTFNSAKITFSEAVRNEAVTPGNYVFSGGLTVTDANFDVVVAPDDQKNPANPANRLAVVLLTSQQTEGASYSLTINNVKDQIGNNLTPNTTTMYANVFRPGVLTYKRWNNAGKNDKAALEADPVRYANVALVETVTLCERGSPAAPEPGYIGMIGGFFIPPVTTNYVFFTSQDADNGAVIYLSTDASPAHRKLLCYDPSWQNARNWLTPSDGNTRRGLSGAAPFENRSDQLLTSDRAISGQGPLLGLLPADGTDPDPWPVLDSNGNAFITLTAGVRYAFQQWQPERDGGQMSATFKYVGPNNSTAGSEPDPANGTPSRLTGNVIGAFIDPSSVPPILSIGRPSGIMTITYTGRLLSSTTANGTYLPVVGATSPYTVPTPTVGSQYYRAVFP